VSPRHVPGRHRHPEPRAARTIHRKPEFVENFFEFIAQEVREYLAMLGARTLDEVIGDVTRLSVQSLDDPTNDLDLSRY